MRGWIHRIPDFIGILDIHLLAWIQALFYGLGELPNKTVSRFVRHGEPGRRMSGIGEIRHDFNRHARFAVVKGGLWRSAVAPVSQVGVFGILPGHETD